MITREQVNGLKHGDILYHTFNRNADGTPQRWRVNGKLKTWKTRPGEFILPIKNGLRNYDYLTERDSKIVCLTEEEAMKSVANF